ncbi:MAG: FliG C-terminal domain-containing protein [Planctomycetaceae bacterium]
MASTGLSGYRSRYVSDLHPSMNPQTQTIELLRLLGDDTAEAVLAHLDSVQADRLRAGLSDEGQEELDRDDHRDLLDQFGRFMDFAVAAGIDEFSIDGPTLHDESTEEQPGPDDSTNGGTTDDVSLKLTGDPLQDLAALSVHQVAGALDTEQPRTVAILLSEFSYQMTADVLSLLRPEHQAAVVVELARELEAPRVLVDRIARATFQRGLTLPADEPDRRDRLDRLSDVLRAVPKKLRRNMMTGIEEDDQEMSQALMKKLYRFEDLVSLDGRVIQQVLGEVDGTTLTTAMFQAPVEITDAILGNLSKRARKSIEEEMTFQSQVPEARVEAARDSVTEVIARLDQDSE